MSSMCICGEMISRYSSYLELYLIYLLIAHYFGQRKIELLKRLWCTVYKSLLHSLESTFVEKGSV